MRAAQIREFGPPQVLRTVEIDEPVAGPGEVLIDVEFAGITFIETQLRAGRPPVEAMRPALPAVLGNGVAGVVVDVGRDVPDTLRGAAVVSSLSGLGGYAERAVADARRPIRVPESLGLDQAAALVADGRTAMAIMAGVGDVAGRTVLVDAAGGGVGSLLVQLVTAAGGRVVALASSAAKLDRATDLGAAVTVDYSDPAWSDAVRTRVGDVDIALDGVGGRIGRATLALVRPGGGFCAFGTAAGAGMVVADRERPDVTMFGTGALDLDRQVRMAVEAIGLAASGVLQASIGVVTDLDDAAAAHAAIEQRSVVGKTLLRMR